MKKLVKLLVLGLFIGLFGLVFKSQVLADCPEGTCEAGGDCVTRAQNADNKCWYNCVDGKWKVDECPGDDPGSGQVQGDCPSGWYKEGDWYYEEASDQCKLKCTKSGQEPWWQPDEVKNGKCTKPEEEPTEPPKTSTPCSGLPSGSGEPGDHELNADESRCYWCKEDGTVMSRSNTETNPDYLYAYCNCCFVSGGKCDGCIKDPEHPGFNIVLCDARCKKSKDTINGGVVSGRFSEGSEEMRVPNCQCFCEGTWQNGATVCNGDLDKDPYSDPYSGEGAAEASGEVIIRDGEEMCGGKECIPAGEKECSSLLEYTEECIVESVEYCCKPSSGGLLPSFKLLIASLIKPVKAAPSLPDITIVVKDKESGKQWTFSVGTDGKFNFKVPGGKSYQVTISAPGYQEVVSDWNPDKNSQYWMDIKLNQSSQGEINVKQQAGSQYQLDQGWNLITPNVQTDFNAQQLLDLINQSGGSVSLINRWLGDHWQPYVLNVSQQPFDMTPGEGYALMSGNTTNFIWPGDPVTESINYQFGSGWNLVGFPKSSDQDVQSLINLLGGPSRVSEVDRWLAGAWQPFLVKTVDDQTNQYGDSFSISPHEGYFVKAEQSFSWEN